MKKRRLLQFRPRSFELFSSRSPKVSLPTEIVSGITVGLIAIPLALALGIASVPTGAETPLAAPALGILTAVIAGFIISALGGSRVQIGGPTAAFIPIIILIISRHGYSGLLLATMMAGVILIVMGLARMGALIKFIPWPVTSGFTSGIAVAIIVTQIPDFLGLGVESAMPQEFFEKWPWLLEHAGLINLPSALLAIGSVAVILLWPKLRDRPLPDDSSRRLSRGPLGQLYPDGSHVILSGIHQQPLQMLRKAGFLEILKIENFCATFDDALIRAESLLEAR